MIPTSIDGTDITGATIDGTDVQEITVDGQTVFSAEKIIDDFEDGNLNEYSGATGSFTINSTNVQNGNLALQSTASFNDMYSEPGDGLANYPVKGDTIRLFMGGTSDVTFHFCVQNGNRTQTYQVVSQGNRTGNFIIQDTFAGNQTVFSGATNQIFDFEVVWGQTTLDLTVRDLNGNLINSGSLTHSDAAPSGGILFRTAAGATYDYIRIV